MPGPAHRQPLTGGARIPHQRRDLLLRPWPGDADGLAAGNMAKVLSDALQGIRLRHDHPGPPIPAGRPGPAQLYRGIVTAASPSTQPEPPRAPLDALTGR